MTTENMCGDEARLRMNKMAAEGRSFLFIIDYEQEHCHVADFEDIDNSCLKFDFRGITNVNNGAGLYYSRNIQWEFTPPEYKDYQERFEVVKQNILKGNSYLTNLTERIPVQTNIGLEEIFHRAEAPYKLWMNQQFVCFSPETFIRINAGIISSYPMKGTIDATIPHARQLLTDDRKETAEHATIVDLIRNDLSIVASQVQVKRYRYIEEICTNRGRLLQTSSEIEGTLPAGYINNIGDIIFSQLPAGSITGAPKPKTKEIIREAENYNREFYTGVMGYYSEGTVDSAVMIRFLEEENGQMYFKAGGGITSKSDCKKEYQELIQKIYVPVY